MARGLSMSTYAAVNSGAGRLLGRTYLTLIAAAAFGALGIMGILPAALAAAASGAVLLITAPRVIASLAYVAVVIVDTMFMTAPLVEFAGFGIWMRDVAMLATVVGFLPRLDAARLNNRVTPHARNFFIGAALVFLLSPVLTWQAIGGDYVSGTLQASWRCALQPLYALVLAYGLRDSGERHVFVKGIMAIAAAVALTVVLNVDPPEGVGASLEPRFGESSRRGGIINDPEGAAALALLAMGIVYSYTTTYRNRTWLVVGSGISVLMAVAIILTQTRAVLIALIGGSALLFVFDRRSKAKVQVAVLGAVLALLLAVMGSEVIDRLRGAVGDEYGFRESNTEYRIMAWRMAYNAVFDSNLLGVGWCGLVQYITQPDIVGRYSNYFGSVYMVSSLAAEMLASFGILAPIVYFAFIRGILKLSKPLNDGPDDIVRALGRVCAFAFFIALQGHMIIVPAYHVTALLWMILGVIASCSKPIPRERPHLTLIAKYAAGSPFGATKPSS